MSLYPCFSLSLYLNVYSSVRIYYHSFLVYMYVSSFRVSVSLLCNCSYLSSAILSLIVQIEVRLLFRVFVHLSFPLSFWVSGYIIDNLHVCDQARSNRSVCSSALENLCIIINSTCTSIDSDYDLSLWLWMSIPLSGYIVTDCMCIYVFWSCLFFSFSLYICSSVRLFCDSLYVYMPRLLIRVSLSLVSEYISQCSAIINVTCRGTCLDPYFSLSFSLNTSLSVRLYCLV